MKKNFMTRALTVALSAAMALSLSVVGGISADAASKPAFAKKSVTIAADKDDVAVKATAATKKTYKIKSVSTSDKSVATVKKNVTKGYVRIKRATEADGSATISVKFKNKKTGSTYKSAIKIKVTVAAKEAAFSVAETELNLVKGEEKALTVTGKDVTFKSSDDKVATVDATGKVTAVGAGSADINVTCGDKTAKVAVKVVKAKLTAVQQTKADEFVATIAGDTTGLAVKDFNFASQKTDVLESIIYPINKITVDAKDASKVTINTFSRLVDGKVYTLTFDGVSIDVTVSDGKVASIVPDTVTVPYNELTQIDVQAKDANGVILESSKDSANITVDFKDITVPGYKGSKKGEILLAKKDDTAKLSAAWHSNKYDPATGKEIDFVEIKDVVITAVDQALVNNFDMRIDTTPKAYAKMGTELLAKGLGTYYLTFSIKNEKGVDIKDVSEYSIETSDKDVFTVTAFSNKAATLTAYKKGTAFVILKKGTTVVKAFQVDVVDAAKVATMTLSANALTVSNAVNNLAQGTQTTSVDVKFVDQYGKDYTPTDGTIVHEWLTFDGAAKAAGTGAAGVLGYSYNTSTKKISLDPKNQTKGTYVFRITYKDKDGNAVCAQTLTVTVQAPSTDSTATKTYAIKIDKTSVDTTIKSGSDIKAQAVTITIAESTNGILSGVTNAAITIKKGDKFIKTFTDKIGGGVDVRKDDGTTGIGDGSGTVTGASVKIDVVTIDGNKYVSKLEAGTYTVEAKVAGNTYNNSFVVSDSQATEIPVRVDYNNTNGDKVDAPTTANVLAKTIITGPTGLDIYYNVDGKANTVKETAVKAYTLSADGKDINVTKIFTMVPVKNKDDVTYYVPYELATAKTFKSGVAATYAATVNKTAIVNATAVDLRNRVSVPGCTVVSVAAVVGANTSGSFSVSGNTAQIASSQTGNVSGSAIITAVLVNDGAKDIVVPVSDGEILVEWIAPVFTMHAAVSGASDNQVISDLVTAPAGVTITKVTAVDSKGNKSVVTCDSSDTSDETGNTAKVTATSTDSDVITVNKVEGTVDGITFAITLSSNNTIAVAHA